MPIKTVKCPYNPAHIMPESSLLNHLTKCTAPNKHNFRICKYNSVHVYPKQLLQQHQLKCKDRYKYEEMSDDDSWGAGQEENQQQNDVGAGASIEKVSQKFSSLSIGSFMQSGINQKQLLKQIENQQSDNFSGSLIFQLKKDKEPKQFSDYDSDSSSSIQSEDFDEEGSKQQVNNKTDKKSPQHTLNSDISSEIRDNCQDSRMGQKNNLQNKKESDSEQIQVEDL